MSKCECSCLAANSARPAVSDRRLITACPSRCRPHVAAVSTGIVLVPEPVISDNYFCRLTTTRFAGESAVRTACATVRG